MNIDLWNITGMVQKVPASGRWRFNIFSDKIPEGNLEGFASRYTDYSKNPPEEKWFLEFYHQDKSLKSELTISVTNWLDMHMSSFVNLKDNQRVVIKLKKD
jgi:hypothetical protein